MQSENTPAMSSEAIEAATGRDWAAWTAFLDAAGARDMSHTDIANFLYDNKHVERGWWCQAVTIGYEQIIGRRVAGQKCDGKFAASSSKTVAGSIDDALALWLDQVSGQIEFNGVPLDGEGRTSSTEKWRYWRADLADGSKISVNISVKSPEKSVLSVDHSAIGDRETADSWKGFWKSFIAQL